MDQPSGQSSVCDYSLVVGRPDQCYLHYDGEKVSRGCIYNAPFEIQSKCLGGSSECKLCTTAECNAEKVDHNGLCYFCDGTKDANCAALTGYSPIHCPAGDRKGCFRSQIGKKRKRSFPQLQSNKFPYFQMALLPVDAFPNWLLAKSLSANAEETANSAKETTATEKSTTKLVSLATRPPIQVALSYPSTKKRRERRATITMTSVSRTSVSICDKENNRKLSD